jgi:hypothetical protein
MEINFSFMPSSLTRKGNIGEMEHNHITEISVVEYFARRQPLVN